MILNFLKLKINMVIKMRFKNKKNIFFSLFVLFFFGGCAVKTNILVNIGGNEKAYLNVISSMSSKEFVLFSDNKNEAYIKAKDIEGLNRFHLMKYDPNRDAYIYNLKIDDYNFYSKIKTDTVYIHQDKEITKFIFLK